MKSSLLILTICLSLVYGMENNKESVLHWIADNMKTVEVV